MKIEVNGKQHEVKFGIRFIRELDKKHTFKEDGFEIGIGVITVAEHLSIGDPVALADVLFAGTNDLTLTEVETYVEEQADEGNLNKLFEEVGKQLEEAPLTKNQLETIKRQGKQ